MFVESGLQDQPKSIVAKQVSIYSSGYYCNDYDNLDFTRKLCRPLELDAVWPMVDSKPVVAIAILNMCIVVTFTRGASPALYFRLPSKISNFY